MQRVYKYFQFYYNFMIHIENFQILGIIQDGIAYTESSYFLWLIKLILYYIKKKLYISISISISLKRENTT